MTLIGHRTLTFGLVALAVLLAGFYLLPPDARGAAFVFFSGGVGALMVAVAGKSAVGALAGGGGVRGSTAALMTDAKPGDPAAP
jgi:hypothetical protein